jgi:phosphoribosylamine-glycine ligase
MDEDMARIMATSGIAAATELTRLFAVLAEHLPEEEVLRRGVADALAEIGLKVLNPAYAACPALEAEFARRIEKYGRMT